MPRKSRELAFRLAPVARALRKRIAPSATLALKLSEALGGELDPRETPDCLAQLAANAAFAAAALGRKPKDWKAVAELAPAALAGCLAPLSREREAARLLAICADAPIAGILVELGAEGSRRDPVTHFYESFLEAYDPRARKALGAYYTPDPVIGFLKRSADRLLRERLGLPQGLADGRAIVIDPACGTGAFLAGGPAIPGMTGYELSPAACAVANLSLGLRPEARGRARLTRSLDETLARTRDELARRGDDAALAILGNPPYSRAGHSRGAGIDALLESYKAAVRGATNLQPLSDDYIRFIRFAQQAVEERGRGVTALITSSSFLTGRVHRGMREELLRAYSSIWVLDLHGSAKVESAAVPGDENIFDIQQGVCITLMARVPGAPPARTILHAELGGSRAEKLRKLACSDVGTIAWSEIAPEEPLRAYVPRAAGPAAEYERGIPLDSLFARAFTGVGTGRDEVFVSRSRRELARLGRELLDPRVGSRELLRRHGLRDTPSWNLSRRRRALEGRRRPRVESYCYRPFDRRYVLYEPVIRRDQRANMALMEGGNVALLACQQLASREFSHVFCAAGLTDESVLSNKTRERAFLFPLRGPEGFNLSVAPLEAACGERLTAEEAFHYACAVLHSPSYRERYRGCLGTDFPRIPLVSDAALVRRLARLGRQIARLEIDPPGGATAGLHVRGTGSGRIERVRIESGEVSVNRGQRIEGIPPEALAARIGCYAVCEKWLKERRGLKLSRALLAELGAIVVALRELARLGAEIDALVAERGGWSAVTAKPLSSAPKAA